MLVVKNKDNFRVPLKITDDLEQYSYGCTDEWEFDGYEFYEIQPSGDLIRVKTVAQDWVDGKAVNLPDEAECAYCGTKYPVYELWRECNGNFCCHDCFNEFEEFEED